MSTLLSREISYASSPSAGVSFQQRSEENSHSTKMQDESTPPLSVSEADSTTMMWINLFRQSLINIETSMDNLKKVFAQVEHKLDSHDASVSQAFASVMQSNESLLRSLAGPKLPAEIASDIIADTSDASDACETGSVACNGKMEQHQEHKGLKLVSQEENVSHNRRVKADNKQELEKSPFAPGSEEVVEIKKITHTKNDVVATAAIAPSAGSTSMTIGGNEVNWYGSEGRHDDIFKPYFAVFAVDKGAVQMPQINDTPADGAWTRHTGYNTYGPHGGQTPRGAQTPRAGQTGTQGSVLDTQKLDGMWDRCVGKLERIPCVSCVIGGFWSLGYEHLVLYFVVDTSTLPAMGAKAVKNGKNGAECAKNVGMEVFEVFDKFGVEVCEKLPKLSMRNHGRCMRWWRDNGHKRLSWVMTGLLGVLQDGQKLEKLTQMTQMGRDRWMRVLHELEQACLRQEQNAGGVWNINALFGGLEGFVNGLGDFASFAGVWDVSEGICEVEGGRLVESGLGFEHGEGLFRREKEWFLELLEMNAQLCLETDMLLACLCFEMFARADSVWDRAVEQQFSKLCAQVIWLSPNQRAQEMAKYNHLKACGTWVKADCAHLIEFLTYNETMRSECVELFKLLQCCNIFSFPSVAVNVCDDATGCDSGVSGVSGVTGLSGASGSASGGAAAACVKVFSMFDSVGSVILKSNVVELTGHGQQLYARKCVDPALTKVYDTLRRCRKSLQHCEIREYITLQHDGSLVTSVGVSLLPRARGSCSEARDARDVAFAEHVGLAEAEARDWKQDEDEVQIVRKESNTTYDELKACMEHITTNLSERYELTSVTFENYNKLARHEFEQMKCQELQQRVDDYFGGAKSKISISGLYSSISVDNSHIICSFWDLASEKFVVCLALCATSNNGASMRRFETFCRDNNYKCCRNELTSFRRSSASLKKIIYDCYTSCNQVLSVKDVIAWWRRNELHVANRVNPFCVKQPDKMSNIVALLEHNYENGMERLEIDMNNDYFGITGFQILSPLYTEHDAWAQMLLGAENELDAMRFVLFASVMKAFDGINFHKNDRNAQQIAWYDLNQSQILSRIRYDTRIVNEYDQLSMLLFWCHGWDAPSRIPHCPRKRRQLKVEYIDCDFDINAKNEEGWRIYGIYQNQSKLNGNFKHFEAIQKILSNQDCIVLHLFKFDENGCQTKVFPWHGWQ